MTNYCARTCARARACVCVCVRARAREREREQKLRGKNGTLIEQTPKNKSPIQMCTTSLHTTAKESVGENCGSYPHTPTSTPQRERNGYFKKCVKISLSSFEYIQCTNQIIIRNELSCNCKIPAGDCQVLNFGLQKDGSY